MSAGALGPQFDDFDPYPKPLNLGSDPERAARARKVLGKQLDTSLNDKKVMQRKEEHKAGDYMGSRYN